LRYQGVVRIEDEIKQKSFKSKKEKALVNLVFTYNWIKEKRSKTYKEFGLSSQQFNILRILRGQHPNAASVKLLTERMLDKMSNASRLVDKLLEKELVDRHYCPNDRRQVDVLITKKGLNLINAASIKGDELLKDFAITETEAATLSAILDKIRD